MQEILDQGGTQDPLDQRWEKSSTFVIIKLSKRNCSVVNKYFFLSLWRETWEDKDSAILDLEDRLYGFLFTSWYSFMWLSSLYLSLNSSPGRQRWSREQGTQGRKRRLWCQRTSWKQRTTGRGCKSENPIYVQVNQQTYVVRKQRLVWIYMKNKIVMLLDDTSCGFWFEHKPNSQQKRSCDTSCSGGVWCILMSLWNPYATLIQYWVQQRPKSI